MAREPRGPRPPTAAELVVAKVKAPLDAYLADPTLAEAEAVRHAASLPPDVIEKASQVIVLKALGYRDGLIIQTATGLVGMLAEEGHTYVGRGGRGVASAIGTLLDDNHIAAVRDAYQNIGKNSRVLVRNVQPAFDDILRWLDAAAETDREALLGFVLARVSLTARNVLDMPDLDRAALTFHRCAVFLEALLATPSGGAYQQFGVASFLYAMLDELGQIGPAALRVETKNLTASDRSSKVAGDVQVWRANRVEEAFEVTANDWRSKVRQAVEAAKSEDLQRAHILAHVEPGFLADAKELEGLEVDITVIDVGTYLRTLLAIMRKPARAAALVRFYQLLDRLQPDIERTNAFVKLLRAHGLAAPA